MAELSGRALLLAVCLLHLILQIEGGFKSPQQSTKHDYTIEVEQVDMLSTPSEFYGPDTFFYTLLYNDTTQVLEADMFVVKTFPDDVTLSITVHGFNVVHNNWAETVRKEMLFCEFLQQGSNYFEDIFTTGNLTQQCPHEPGYYYFRELLLSPKEFPLHMEDKKWRVNIDFYPNSTKETFLSMAIFVWSKPLDDEDDFY